MDPDVPHWKQPPTPEDPGRPLHLGQPDRDPEQRVAALSDQYDVDMTGFRPGVHDVRIERDGWVYYVRAARWGESLAEGPLREVWNPLFLLLGQAGTLVWWGVRVGVHKLQKRPRWRVGVIVGPSPSSWNTGRVRQLHQERLEPGEEPSARIAALAAEVEAGGFDVVPGPDVDGSEPR